MNNKFNKIKVLQVSYESLCKSISERVTDIMKTHSCNRKTALEIASGIPDFRKAKNNLIEIHKQLTA